MADELVLSEGRIVHYVITDICRGAIITRVWSPKMANLSVFLDWNNDIVLSGHLNPVNADRTLGWATNVVLDEAGEHLTFHDPRYCPFISTQEILSET